jgi:hypothetical protein
MEPATTNPEVDSKSIPDAPRRLWRPTSKLPISAEGIWTTLDPIQQRNVVDALVRLCCHLANRGHDGVSERDDSHDSH